MHVAQNFPSNKTALALLIGAILNANPGIRPARADLNLSGPFCGPLHTYYATTAPFQDTTLTDGVSGFGSDIFDCYEGLIQGEPATLAVKDNDFYVFGSGFIQYLTDIYTQTTPANGSLTRTTLGTGEPAFIYTPRIGFSGRDTFEYQTGSRNVSEWFRIVRVDVFVLPDANDDSYTVNNAQSNVVFDVVANDVGVGDHPPDNALTITKVYPGSVQGTVAISNNELLFTPQSSASGTQSFVYEVADATGLKANATVTVNVQQVPVASDDGIFTLGCNTQTTANVLANDRFTGDVFVTVSTPPASGAVQVLSDNQFQYTPNPNFSGPDSVRYQLRDSVGNASADVRFSVLPAAADDVAKVPYQASTSGNLIANDCGTALTVTANSAAGKGSVTVQGNGSFIYSAAAGQLGADSFTYTARDSNNNNTVATVRLTIDPPNFTANADSFGAVCGNPIADNVTSNDSFTPPANVIVVSNVTNGTLNLAANGSFNYSPAAGFSGNDGFSYRYVNSNTQATVTLSLRPSATNDAANVAYAGTMTGNVLDNDCGNTLAVVSNTSPGKGTLTVSPNGTFSYQASTGQWGADSFSYTARDSSGNNVVATVNLTIAVPVISASNDSYNAACGAKLTGSVLGNDDYVGMPSVSLMSGAVHGTLSLATDGSFDYVPNAGFSGLDAFSYKLSTPAGNATANVNLLVLPSAANLAVTVPYASAISSNAISQACGTGLTVTAMGTPAKGILNYTSDGGFTYKALAGQTGADSFSVETRDANNQNVSSTVNVTIGAAPGFSFFYNNQLFDNTTPLPADTGAVQSAIINQPFRHPLIVKIIDANGLPVPGINICFTAIPGSNGASAELNPSHVLSDAQGVAQVLATANGIAGAYQVRAELCRITSPVLRAAAVANTDLRSPLFFALNNAPLPMPIPLLPWQSLAWLATLLGYLGYRRIRSG